MSWDKRVRRWLLEGRRHRRAAPGPRLTKDPAPKVIGELPSIHHYWDQKTLVFSDGGCFAPNTENRYKIGYPPKFLERGYWLLWGSHGSQFVGDANQARVLLASRETKIISVFTKRLKQINIINSELE